MTANAAAAAQCSQIIRLVCLLGSSSIIVYSLILTVRTRVISGILTNFFFSLVSGEFRRDDELVERIHFLL